MKKLVAVTATLSAAALVLTGCSATSAEGAGEDRVSLNVGYIDTSVNGVGVIAVANELGLWEEAGIDVTLTPFTNGPTQIQAMASGSLDIGYIGGGATWMPASGQATIITPNESTFGDYLIASPESGATSMSDLKGLSVGVPDGGSGEMILSLALEEAGLTFDDIERVPLDPPSVVSAFVSGQIDVAAIFSPLSDQIFESVPDAVVLANNRDFPETSRRRSSASSRCGSRSTTTASRTSRRASRSQLPKPVRRSTSSGGRPTTSSGTRPSRSSPTTRAA